MDVKPDTLDQASAQILNPSSMEDGSILSPFIYDHHYLRDPQFGRCEVTSITSLDDILTNITAGNLTMTAKPFGEQLTPNYLTDLDHLGVQSYVNSIPKKYMNGEMQPYLLQKFIGSKASDTFSHQQLVSHISMTMPPPGLSYDFYNSNTPCQQIGCATIGNDSIYDSGFIERALRDENKQGATTYIAHDKSMTVPVATSQFTRGMDLSPEQMSSITVCSDGNGYYDCAPVNVDPNFPDCRLQESSGTLSDNCFQQNHFDWGEVDSKRCSCFMGNNQCDFHKFSPLENMVASSNAHTQKVDLWGTPDVPDTSMISERMDFLQSQLQMTGSLQLHQQSPSNKPSEVQSHWYSVEKDETFHIAEQMEYKVPQICLEQSNGVQNAVAMESSSVFSAPVQVAQHTDSRIFFFCGILSSYINYKSMPMNSGNVQVSFLKYIHSKLCSGGRCNCKKYDRLISHFENCHYPMCKICVPARQLCVINGEVQLASGEVRDDLPRASVHGDSNGTISHMTGKIMRPLKRMKVENSFPGVIGVSHIFDRSVDQPCTPAQPLYFERLPHIFNKVNTIEAYKGLSSTKEYAENHGFIGNDVTDSAQSLNLLSAALRKDDLSRASLDSDSNDVGYLVIGEIMSPLESLMTKDSFPVKIEVSNAVASVDLPCAPDRPLSLEQCTEVPLFSNVDMIEVKNDLLKKYAENLEMRCDADNAQKLNLCNVLNPLEDLTVHLIEGKIESVHKVQDDFQENIETSREDILPDCFEASTTIDPKEAIKDKSESAQMKLYVKSDLVSYTANRGSEEKLRESKLPGVSLVDFFTAEQMKEHISSCRRWKHQHTSTEAFEATRMDSVDENSCQLCAMDKFAFAPIPVYCSSCGILIKRKLIYYWADSGGAQYCFCASCFKRSNGDIISFHGISISKAKLHKERNDKEYEESWVQCDKCKCWQHQICALYNDKRDLEGKAEYVCPQCCLEEIEIGKRVPLQKATVFGAKDLPTTMLSDHIEQRLVRSLEQQRKERESVLGKNPDEVPGAEDLVVRVVLSVNKHLKVKREFLDIFCGENYPSEFMYRSKVILLFQKIEGVDVCIFSMYVQEFGSECGYPNQRCVYISYLDSVKYFRPEIVTLTGEALRTFVYHEILIGYLDYCKKQGFAMCYIWACPPLRGEDYILYCHPENQRTPKSDKLRQWYEAMLRKATQENVVVDYTNIHDHLFAPAGECNTKITAARLPYFDGAYWCGAAEDIIRKIEKECGVGLQKKVRKLITKRSLKAIGQSNSSDDVAKDVLVMEKLGQTILPKKEDFIVVHLHFTCSLCHEVILSGRRWICHQCRGFQLCTRCLNKRPNSDGRRTHTSTGGEKHTLSQVLVDDVPHDTDDKDGNIDNALFENRHAFLGFCQSNHYQFDTLRRAKHSSMMILYHLNKPAAFTLENRCRVCHKDVAADQSWHCETCPEFDVCDACYQRKGSICHVHNLAHGTLVVSCETKTRKAQLRQDRSLQERRLLDVLMHASECHATKSNPCTIPKCLEIRRLFKHSGQCKLRAAGGCILCKKTWFLLQLHSQSCGNSSCCIPRCRDIKKHSEMHALQSNTPRRAAVLGLENTLGCREALII